jgi:hypothetical protein
MFNAIKGLLHDEGVQKTRLVARTVAMQPGFSGLRQFPYSLFRRYDATELQLLIHTRPPLRVPLAREEGC